MKTLVIFLTAVFSAFFAKSQSDIAKEDNFGDARVSALAGGTGALGGTFASSLQNPAALSFCQKNELSVSPFLKIKRNQSLMLDNISSDERWKQGIGNIGFVYKFGSNNRGRAKSAWSNLNIGLGYMRTADFNDQFLAEGTNKTNSLLNAFLQEVNFGEGIKPENLDPMSTGLAFQTMLIDTLPRQFQYDSVKYFSAIPYGGALQSLSIARTGAVKTLSFGFAATYGKRISLGLNVLRPDVYLAEERIYRESDNAGDSIPYFNNFTYTQSRTASGKGIGMKGGVIVKANDWLRLGASFQTPMFINMSESRQAAMKSELVDRKFEAESQEVISNYQLTTPSKAVGSIAVVKANEDATKSIAFNVDYESVNYKALRLRADSGETFDLNRNIQNELHPTANLRVGLEGRMKKVLLRAGSAMFGNPMVGNPFVELNPKNLATSLATFERINLSCGFGLTDVLKSRTGRGGLEYFVEGAYIHSRVNNAPFAIYQLKSGDSPVVAGVSTEHRVVLTLGIRF